MEQDPAEVIRQFDRLGNAMIDASSMIYLSKAGCLRRLAETIPLFTLPEIKAEAGEDSQSVQIVKAANSELSNDEKLMACAFESRLPLITEDRRIVLTAVEKELPVFNALMMLCFMLYRGVISEKEYGGFLKSLKDVAWYSRKVWEFGRRVHDTVIAG